MGDPSDSLEESLGCDPIGKEKKGNQPKMAWKIDDGPDPGSATAEGA